MNWVTSSLKYDIRLGIKVIEDDIVKKVTTFTRLSNQWITIDSNKVSDKAFVFSYW